MAGRTRDTASRRWRAGTWSTAWLLSAIVHAAAALALSHMTRLAPQGAGNNTSVETGIVLTARFSDRDESKAESQFRVRPVNLAPELLPLPAPARPMVAQPALLPGKSSVIAASYQAPISPSAGIEVNPPPAAAAAQPAQDHATETRVFGVRGKGSRFVYVFDRSSSMEGPPLVAAKRELIASVQSLQANHQFQIIFYNEEPQVMPDFRGRASTMVFANDPGKRLAANFVGSVSAHGSTDHLRALRTALTMRPDVIFLLTDASEPQLSPAELAAIRRLNERTTISTIEFGLGPVSPQYNFLQQLAAQNGGQHTYVDLLRLLR